MAIFSVDPAPVRQPVLDQANPTSGLLSGIWQKWFSAIQTNLGLGLIASNNLSDVKDVPSARGNLGLTGAATMALPVSIANGGTGATDLADAQTNLGIASILDAALTNAPNTFSQPQTFQAGITSGGASTSLDIDTGSVGTDARIVLAGHSNVNSGIYLDSPTSVEVRDALGTNVIAQLSPTAIKLNQPVTATLTVNAPLAGSLGGWQTWTPAITPASGMTVSGFSVGGAEYIHIGPMIFFNFQVSFTLGGTAALSVAISLPVFPLDNLSCFNVFCASGSTNTNIVGRSDSGNYSLFRPSPNSTNWTLGAQSITVSGMYRTV